MSPYCKEDGDCYGVDNVLAFPFSLPREEIEELGKEKERGEDNKEGMGQRQ